MLVKFELASEAKLFALIGSVGTGPLQDISFTTEGSACKSEMWQCVKINVGQGVHRESLNMMRKRLISAFKPPAPAMDSTSTEDNSPIGAMASASQGSSVHISARLETPAMLLLALNDIGILAETAVEFDVLQIFLASSD